MSRYHGGGLLGSDGVELGVVVELEVDLCAGDGTALEVGDGHCGLGGGGVVADYVDFGIVGGDGHDFFRAFVAAEDFGVHQHAAAGGGVEPAKVQDGFGFTGTEEVPLTIRPGFYPGVVVVSMRPSGSVDLTRRNADGAEGGNEQGGLFATAAVGSADGGKGRAGASIGGGIDGFLMTPVVNLEDGVVEGKGTYAVFQFTIEDDACAVERFVVHRAGSTKWRKRISGMVFPQGISSAARREARMLSGGTAGSSR